MFCKRAKGAVVRTGFSVGGPAQDLVLAEHLVQEEEISLTSGQAAKPLSRLALICMEQLANQCISLSSIGLQ